MKLKRNGILSKFTIKVIEIIILFFLIFLIYYRWLNSPVYKYKHPFKNICIEEKVFDGGVTTSALHIFKKIDKETGDNKDIEQENGPGILTCVPVVEENKIMVITGSVENNFNKKYMICDTITF